MVAVKKAPLRQAPKANKLAVFLGVAAALVITGAREAAQLLGRVKPASKETQALVSSPSAAAETRRLPPAPNVSRSPRSPGLPLLNKTVRQREQNVAAMRDAQYDPQLPPGSSGGSSSRAEAKNDARDDRLRARR